MLPGFAQNKKANKKASVQSASDALSLADSMAVKQLYLDGLHGKIIQNYQLAADYFKRVIELDPANAPAMYELANIYHAQNKEPEARALMNKAVSISPDNQWYWILLADIYKKTNDIAPLPDVFDQLIRLSPDDENSYYDKANALYLLNKITEATTVYNEIEKRFGPSDDLSEGRQRILIKQGKTGKATSELESQIVQHPEDLRNYLNLADIFSSAGNRNKAIEVLKKAALVEPGNAMIRLALASNYQALGRFEEAFIELKIAFADPSLHVDEKVRIVLSFFPQFEDYKARAYAEELALILTKTHPNDPKGFALYGDVLFQEQKYPEAAQQYRKALSLNNQVYQIWEQLLRIDISNSDFKSGVSDGEAALAIFPNQAVLNLFTGVSYAQTQQYEKAIPALKMAASLETEDKEVQAQIYSALGDAYNALKRYRESDEVYEKSLELSPDNSYALNNYAYYLAMRGEKLDKAAIMSKRSIALVPDNASFEDTYAWILFRQKKYQEARTWMEKALNNSEEESAVQMEHYGDILYHLGDVPAALLQWQKAKQAGGDSEKLNQKINGKKYIE